jgi:thiol peroxidase
MSQTTIRGNPVTTAGDLPTVGSPAPAFTLTRSDMSSVSLADLAGKRVVLSTFPSVDTAVCATSVRTFNQRAGEVDNTVVLNVSADLPFALKRFCGAEGIANVETASVFRNPDFGDAYGVRMVDGGLHGLLARAVVVIDTDGTVLHSQLVPDIVQEPDYDAALAVLR